MAFAVVVVLALVPALSGVARAAKNGGLPEGTISEVKIEGNNSVTSERVRAKLLSKVGGPLDAQTISTDISSLMNEKWFSNVETFYEVDKRDASGKSYVLIFTVKEMPMLAHVEFRGRKAIKLKEIEELTGLKKGNRADVTRTHLAVGQIKRLYEEKGYETAEVRLIEGGNPGDTKVVIGIFEGPKFVVESIDFKGNLFATDAQLRSKITSRTRLFGLIGGKYNRDALEEDVRKIRDYFKDQGYFEVQVEPVTRRGSALGKVCIEFDVSEGVRYQVRNIAFEGNTKISTEQLRAGLKLHSGQPILQSIKEADHQNLTAKYSSLGYIDASIMVDPKYTNTPGIVDITYKIEEGHPYLLGEIIIRGNERTKDKVVRREFLMAGVLPGEPLDKNRLDIARKRLAGTQYFVTQQGTGKPLEIKIINQRPHDKPYGDIPLNYDGVSQARMQSPSPSSSPSPNPAPAVAVPRLAQNGPPVTPLAPSFGGPQTAPGLVPAPATGLPGFDFDNTFNPPPDTPPIPVPLPNGRPRAGGAGAGGAPAGSAPASPPVGTGEPPGMAPSIPGLNAFDVGPDRQDPFPGRNFADIVTAVEEAPTGRFMLGVGASSYQGLLGNLTIYERNFDILNIPRSFSDLVGGNAFRGAGQEFQVQLMPGTVMNRFQVSLREPYLFDLPIGASSAGYIFNRIYPDWTESRAGGRFSLGRQIGTSIYTDVAFRIEDVNFYGFQSPAPADYLAASGFTTLATLRPSIRFDNRNSPFMPNKGQYLEFSFEQGWGTFTYPKFEAEGRTYYTLGSRPDGSGKRILTMRGHFGITGSDTPVYERFFAGNYGSLRGFQYRGVGPRVLGSGTGGLMEALGSVEYMFPWMANDKLFQVFFCDFGTVERNYNFTDFRCSVGTGLRIIIPAMGPLPLAFDLAFPVEKAYGDRVQYFNFTIGAMY